MATIALIGTTTDKKVVIKTVDGIQKVSCLFCDPCEALPDTLTVVFSGIQKCPSSTIDPVNGLYEVNLSGGGSNWEYNDSIYYVRVDCFTAKQYMSGGGSGADMLPSGIAIDDCTTPIFDIEYGIYDPEDPITLLEFFGPSSCIKFKYASKLYPATNGTVCPNCFTSGFDGAIGYGGTATISWETTP
jgi:hypothetical protein